MRWQRLEAEWRRLDGEIVAEPLFWLTDIAGTFACFAADRLPSQRTLHRLSDERIQVIKPGQVL